MSANNFLALYKDKDGQFKGYDIAIEGEIETNPFFYLTKYEPDLVADTIEGIIKKAEEYMSREIVEYGYRFVNL